MEAKATLSKSQDSEVLRMKREFDFMMSEVATVRSELRKGLNMRGITSGMSNTNQQQQQEQQTPIHDISQEQQVPEFTTRNDSTSSLRMTNENNVNSQSVQPQNHSEAKGTQFLQHDHQQQQQSPTFNNFTPQSNLNTPQNHGTSSFFIAQLHDPFVQITNKKLIQEASFSAAFAELQQLERDGIAKDPSLKYLNVDPSRVNSFDYDSFPLAFSKIQPNLREAPFSVVEFGHQPMEGLYDETSVGIRTEVMGGGADFVSINVLESLVAKKRSEI
ncbi:hypothetical protein FDP41_005173 [Naegleria fowleri]|uniref:Uncharacterized protein n=1 Tax=Naegleria fowleri TaxID=5763 RepID=A0A6A5BLT1_NAEFO|nr:uncharacterized protein FDP41_005173 [Naegleria fowleri]KAF0975846.1 hypothetical protein FDP41_005173 [Naegleria fowleri]